MLKAHLDAVEQNLLSQSRIPANAGHTLHRGTPREAFIAEFLTGHLSARLAVGTGEIIDASSLPRQPRNQFDIVIYKSEYPRIVLGSKIHAFLAESVVATIEVKSLLTQQDLDSAIKNAHTAKTLQRNIETAFTAGYVPPGILSYVVAYDGPANIRTVYNWLKATENAGKLNQGDLPQDNAKRCTTLSEGVEGIFLLGKGCILFDSAPLTMIDDQTRSANPKSKYQLISEPDGNIFWLFLLLTQAASNVVGQWGNLEPYLKRYQTTGLTFVP